VRQSLGPDAVRSHATGIGVIWLSSLLVNHDSENCGVVMSMLTTYWPAAWTFVTSFGRPWGVQSVLLLPSAMAICSQKTTSCAVTGSPFDQW
jgi:hypothetical protein